MVLRDHAGAFEYDTAIGNNIVQIAQPVAEQQLFNVANECMFCQVRFLAYGGAARNILGAAVQLQRVIQQLGAQVRTSLRAFKRDGDVGFPFGQADETRYRHDIQRDGGKASLKIGHERSRSEEHTSELQSLMRISYAVFCLKKKKYKHTKTHKIDTHNNI